MAMDLLAAKNLRLRPATFSGLSLDPLDYSLLRFIGFYKSLSSRRDALLTISYHFAMHA